MPRPCDCDHVEYCQFCYRWHTSEWHRVQWGGPKEQPPPPKPRDRPTVRKYHVTEPPGTFTHEAGVLQVHHQGAGYGYQSAFGVCHELSARSLAAAGVRAHAAGVVDYNTVGQLIESRPWLTHCTIEAPFLENEQVADLAARFPWVRFVVRSHSQFGFMGSFRVVVERLRWAGECGLPNVSVAFNSLRTCDPWRKMYGGKPAYLPNAYPDFEPMYARKAFGNFGPINVGSFGCLRPLKNFVTTAAAAIVLSRKLGRPLRFHLNTGRVEDGGQETYKVIEDLLRGVGELVPVPWMEWREFRKYLAENIDLCLHPSFTETFSIVSADAVAEGVPVVGSRSIDWLPCSLWCKTDDAEDIANAGVFALSKVEHYAASSRNNLHRHHLRSVKHWLDWLSETMPSPRGVTRVEPCRHLGASVSFCGSCAPPRMRPYLHLHQCGHPEGDEKGPNRDGIVSRLRDCEKCEHYDSV